MPTSGGLGYLRRALCPCLLAMGMLVLLLSGKTVGGSVGVLLVLAPNSAINPAPVILQNGIAGASTVYTNDTSAKVSVGGFGQMCLYVDAYDGNKTAWTRVGISPYLDAIDYDANFVNASGSGSLVGNFGFADSGKSAVAINSVTVQAYARQSLGKDLRVLVWNGSAWTSLGERPLSNTWRWENYTATSILDTWAKIDAAEIYLESRSPAGVYAVDCATLHVNFTIPSVYDYVLRISNTVPDSWQARLKAYSDWSIGRLQNCTVYFHNATDGTSSQLVVENGAIINTTGPWYDLGNSETIYIAMTAQANSTGTSDIHAFLEILVPNTTTYFQCVIVFTIT